MASHFIQQAEIGAADDRRPIMEEGMVQWTLGMNKANLRPSERTGGQIGEQSMLRRRQIVAIHLVQSGSDEIMVRCNGPRVERRGVGNFPGMGSREERRRGHIAQPRGKLDIL